MVYFDYFESNCFSTFLFQVQFVIVFFHTLQVQFQPTCGYPKSIAALLTLNAALFIYMFSMFYVKSYLRAAKRPAKGTEVNNNLLDCKPKQELEQTEEVDSRQRLVASGEEKKDL